MADNDHPDLPAERQSRPSGKDVPPSISAKSFCCPHCGAYTHQFWYTLLVNYVGDDELPYIGRDDPEEDLPVVPEESRPIWEEITKLYQSGKVFFRRTAPTRSDRRAHNLHLSKCFTCEDIAVWIHDRLVYPPQRNGPEPNSDLPDTVRPDYEEARSILNLSPRGTAALLRLGIEKLCIYLKAEGSALDEKIADLVRKGLDVRVKEALDSVRVIGNEAVHPGQMDLKDDRDTAETLFKLVNVIAEKTISEPKHIEEIYGSLPQSKLDAIERRDKGST